MYDVLMTLFVTAFFALIVTRLYHVHLAKVAKKRAERLARIRAIVAWLRQNTHLPKRLLQRKERQVARTERWAREEAAKEEQRRLGRQVKRILDPYWNLDVRVRAEEQKLGRRIRIHPLVSDEGLTHG